MKKWVAIMLTGIWVGTLVGCGPSEDPQVRMGNLFFKNKQFDSAYQAYEKAVATNPKNLELVRANFKNAYYYYGGQLEMSDSKDAAIKYYEKGFALDPTDVGMCNKLATHYWDQKDYAGAVKYLARLAELDGEAPDSDKKWVLLGEDYYNAGYAQFQLAQYAPAVESFKNSLKVSPKGKKAGKAK
ncbi:MAG: tetratricopeptide repeat protein, partial [Candidatus Firestonebacteria bacterium]|nr:tetratricopeptide repeat protein [Candidatus Firestonebacteria bacterium]